MQTDTCCNKQSAEKKEAAIACTGVANGTGTIAPVHYCICMVTTVPGTGTTYDIDIVCSQCLIFFESRVEQGEPLPTISQSESQGEVCVSHFQICLYQRPLP